jgi:hypothetical protein
MYDPEYNSLIAQSFEEMIQHKNGLAALSL